MPRITRQFCEQLVELIDNFESSLSDVRESAEEWTGLQDEPKNEEVRDQIRDARETLESALGELPSALQELAEFLGK
jgi:hypothetical protein